MLVSNRVGARDRERERARVRAKTRVFERASQIERAKVLRAYGYEYEMGIKCDGDDRLARVSDDRNERLKPRSI